MRVAGVNEEGSTGAGTAIGRMHRALAQQQSSSMTIVRPWCPLLEGGSWVGRAKRSSVEDDLGTLGTVSSTSGGHYVREYRTNARGLRYPVFVKKESPPCSSSATASGSISSSSSGSVTTTTPTGSGFGKAIAVFLVALFGLFWKAAWTQFWEVIAEKNLLEVVTR